MTDSELLERLAALCHDQWRGWMRHLFAQARRYPGGTLLLPRARVERWTRQMATDYADLDEDEKDSDRECARAFLALLAGDGSLD